MAVLFTGFEDCLSQIPLFLESFVKVSLLCAIIAMIISLVIGTITGLMGTSKRLLIRGISRVYVEFFQNTPIIIILFFLFAFSPYVFGKAVDTFQIGTLVLGVYTGAYMCEIIRSGIASISKGQEEAAASQGFN